MIKRPDEKWKRLHVIVMCQMFTREDPGGKSIPNRTTTIHDNGNHGNYTTPVYMTPAETLLPPTPPPPTPQPPPPLHYHHCLGPEHSVFLTTPNAHMQITYWLGLSFSLHTLVL